MENILKIKYEEYTDVEHTVCNFIDDSSSLISFTDHTELNHYLDSYFKILGHCYNTNKLSINPEKTNLLIITN